MKVAYIMRGITGSGKSTLARRLAGSTGRIHSTDDFFYVDGEYIFDPRWLGVYHDRNFDAFCASLAEGIEIVICDNTNSQHWQFERYVDAAKKAGYTVAIVFLPHPDIDVALQRSSHGTQRHTIERMLDRWEP